MNVDVPPGVWAVISLITQQDLDENIQKRGSARQSGLLILMHCFYLFLNQCFRTCLWRENELIQVQKDGISCAGIVCSDASQWHRFTFSWEQTALVSVTTVRDKNKTSCVMLLLNEDINLEGLFSLNQTSSVLFCLDPALHLTQHWLHSESSHWIFEAIDPSDAQLLKLFGIFTCTAACDLILTLRFSFRPWDKVKGHVCTPACEWDDRSLRLRTNVCFSDLQTDMKCKRCCEWQQRSPATQPEQTSRCIRCEFSSVRSNWDHDGVSDVHFNFSHTVVETEGYRLYLCFCASYTNLAT